MTVPRPLGYWLVFVLAIAQPCAMVRAQDPPQKTEEGKPDTFFAGTVIETTSERITISRVVLGKTEKRVFRVTPDTKCEGKLKAKVRVTVRYITTEDGDTAELIVVRTQQKKTKQP